LVINQILTSGTEMQMQGKSAALRGDAPHANPLKGEQRLAPTRGGSRQRPSLNISARQKSKGGNKDMKQQSGLKEIYGRSQTFCKTRFINS